jgi:hypothetical protein
MQELPEDFSTLKINELFGLDDENLVINRLLPEDLGICSRRDLLRKFLKEKGYRQPEFLVSGDFAPISAWAVKRNLFPILLKPANNQANNRNIFLLKAFRELPEFFEEIQNQSPILIESFFPAKARLEATFFNGELILIAQTGTARSLKYLTSWRVFPVYPPSRCLQEIRKAISLFPELKALKNVPLRLGFAFNPERTTPLSINLGFNRHEYFPDYGNRLIDRQSFAEPEKQLNKILFYHLPPEKLTKIDSQELWQLLKTSIKKLEIAETTVILLTSNDASLLLEDSKKADGFFRHLCSEEIRPENED